MTKQWKSKPIYIDGHSVAEDADIVNSDGALIVSDVPRSCAADIITAHNDSLAAVEAENARLREMLAEMLGHMEPLAHHAILGPVGSPREWVSEGREMARQAMLKVGRWGVATLASVPGATGEIADMVPIDLGPGND